MNEHNSINSFEHMSTYTDLHTENIVFLKRKQSQFQFHGTAHRNVCFKR